MVAFVLKVKFYLTQVEESGIKKNEQQNVVLCPPPCHWTEVKGLLTK
jgi:hypothetical protein